MLSSRKSIVDMGSVRRNETLLSNSSRRHHPLSSRMSILNVVHVRRRNGKHLWRVGINVIRFIARVRYAMKLAKLTLDEVQEIATKYYSVMCLNDLASINEFIGSLGIHATSETPSLLAQVKFREGQALTLYQVLRLMTLLKRHHVSTTGSDTVEAFTALAVNGCIPTDVFRSTMMKFDLRVQVQDGMALPKMQDAEGEEPFRRSHDGGDGGIDLGRFRAMLSDEDDSKKRDLIKRRFSRLSSVRAASLHVSEAFESASPTEPRTPSVASPKPFDVLLNQVRTSLANDSEGFLFRRDPNAEKSPLRAEVFPFRSNKRKWDFQDVVKRIDEVNKMVDVHRPLVSRNARYCSSTDRPRLALLTPFTDLNGNGHARHDDSVTSQLHLHRLTRQPSRGLPLGLENAGKRRSASVPLTERFPILAKRRERLMDQLPHRNFESNGSVSWALTQAQRSSLAARRIIPQSDESDRQEILKHIASATLCSVKSH